LKNNPETKDLFKCLAQTHPAFGFDCKPFNSPTIKRNLDVEAITYCMDLITLKVVPCSDPTKQMKRTMAYTAECLETSSCDWVTLFAESTTDHPDWKNYSTKLSNKYLSGTFSSRNFKDFSKCKEGLVKGLDKTGVVCMNFNSTCATKKNPLKNSSNGCQKPEAKSCNNGFSEIGLFKEESVCVQ
jgi:hypothetical protein